MNAHRNKLRALEFIRDYQLAYEGEVPSMREIAKGLGFTSPSVAHRLVKALEEEGRIRRTPDKHRSIEIVPVTAVIAVELPPDAYEWAQAMARQAKITLAEAVVYLVKDGMEGNLEYMQRARDEASPQMLKDLSRWDTSGLPWQEALNKRALKKRALEKRSAASRKAWRTRKRVSRETGGSNGRAQPQSDRRA